MAKMKTEFRKGNIVVGSGNAVLVTGKGSEDYPSFAGVVIMSQKMWDDDSPWPVGMYSKTWNTDAFKKSNLSMNKIMKLHLKP